MAIELIADRCSPSDAVPGEPCNAECHDCEDIPLSIGKGERVATRHGFDGLPSFGACDVPSVVASGSLSIIPYPVSPTEALRPVSFASHRSPLRC